MISSILTFPTLFFCFYPTQRVIDRCCSLHAPSSDTLDLWQSMSNDSCTSQVFNFDASLWSVDKSDRHYIDQSGVFDLVGRGVLDNAFLGYNACIFAYGQTGWSCVCVCLYASLSTSIAGSGKTYTMMGSPSDPGIIPRLCNGIFERLVELCRTCISNVHVLLSINANRNPDVTYKIEASFMEIYNEKV